MAMTMTWDMLKASEAAVVSRVALRDVHRVIDEEILPKRWYDVDDGRYVKAAACALISFYYETARQLTVEARQWTILEFESRVLSVGAFDIDVNVDIDFVFKSENSFVIIDLKPFFAVTSERIDKLRAAREAVVSDPKILGGT